MHARRAQRQYEITQRTCSHKRNALRTRFEKTPNYKSTRRHHSCLRPGNCKGAVEVTGAYRRRPRGPYRSAGHLNRFHPRATGAAMRVGEAPSTAWTGRHSNGRASGQEYTDWAAKSWFSRIIRPGAGWPAQVARLVRAARRAGALLLFLGLIRALGLTPTEVLARPSRHCRADVCRRDSVRRRDGRPGQRDALPVLVFDRDHRVVSGAAAGQPLSPAVSRDAPRGRSNGVAPWPWRARRTRFPCLHNGKMMIFEAVPVRTADGTVVYGILLSTDSRLPR